MIPRKIKSIKFRTIFFSHQFSQNLNSVTQHLLIQSFLIVGYIELSSMKHIYYGSVCRYNVHCYTKKINK